MHMFTRSFVYYPTADNPIAPTNATTVRKSTMSFSTVSKFRVRVGPLQERVLCLNDRVVQGGAQEATMYLHLHCRKKTKRQWKA